MRSKLFKSKKGGLKQKEILIIFKELD